MYFRFGRLSLSIHYKISQRGFKERGFCSLWSTRIGQYIEDRDLALGFPRHFLAGPLKTSAAPGPKASNPWSIRLTTSSFSSYFWHVISHDFFEFGLSSAQKVAGLMVAANQRVASLFGNFGYLLLWFPHRSPSSLKFITYTILPIKQRILWSAFRRVLTLWLLRSASCRAVNRSSPAYWIRLNVIEMHIPFFLVSEVSSKILR